MPWSLAKDAAAARDRDITVDKRKTERRLRLAVLRVLGFRAYREAKFAWDMNGCVHFVASIQGMTFTYFNDSLQVRCKLTRIDFRPVADRAELGRRLRHGSVDVEDNS